MRLLVTGGAGFIGSNFVLKSLEWKDALDIVVLDKLNYAAHPQVIKNLDHVELVVGDICNKELVFELVGETDVVIHFAAESHNDNSLKNPYPFIDSNIVGTVNILEACRHYDVRLHHISTDEVFGDLALDDPHKFTRNTPYKPSSPYSASKASADMLVRAWVRSFGIKATISNCSNNYGPYQHIEKFIPRMITNRLIGIKPKLYGDGLNVRDWIHVDDHNRGVWDILEKGELGQSYLLGANGELSNLEVVRAINRLMGYPENDFEHVKDRAGHDRRYAIDARDSAAEIGFTPKYTNFEMGLAQTVDWYKTHPEFWQDAKEQVEKSYSEQGQ